MGKVVSTPRFLLGHMVVGGHSYARTSFLETNKANLREIASSAGVAAAVAVAFNLAHALALARGVAFQGGCIDAPNDASKTASTHEAGQNGHVTNDNRHSLHLNVPSELLL